MYRYLSLIALVLAFAPALTAQDDDAESAVDLAIAFPATSMVYARIDTDDYFEALNPEEIFSGLEQADMGVPDLGQIAKDRLELELTDDEVKALAAGVQTTGVALLDITVSGPRYQFVFEHKDLSALERALRQAHRDEAVTVPGIQDYYGTDIFEIYVPLAPVEPDVDPNPWGRNTSSPMQEWANIQDYWGAIIDGKYLVLSTNENAVKDAIDFLSFPDDPIDTLLGNRRYTEAVGDFVDPQAVMFVNVQSVVSALERLAGDQGSGGLFGMILSEFMRGGGEAAEFFVDLVQYEQIKSFASGLWINEQDLTLRMDANLVFHNPPAWFDAVRIEPKEMPLTDYIPGDAMLAITDCIDDVHALYQSAQDFFIARARTAGHDELADAWLEFEKEIADENAGIHDTLSHLGGGQAFVLLPSGNSYDIYGAAPVRVAGLLGVKNLKAAEDFFYDKLIHSKLGTPFREIEHASSPVLVRHGVEIHLVETGEWGFAFMPDQGEAGVFAIGELQALERIIDAKFTGASLADQPGWDEAHGLLWEKGSLHMYINFGSLIATGITAMFSVDRWFMFGDEEEVNFDRDDTERDDDPTEFLAHFFRNTVVVGSVRSAERSVNIRVAAAGWPDSDNLREMALHFRDVERNRQVRDDYVRLRDAARAYFALNGQAPGAVSDLVRAGLIADESWTHDPFGAEDDTPRVYELAEVPEDVDIRQAILLAYQPRPGLRGNHLAVLWNSHIVELTPAQLEGALALAAQGSPLAEETDENGVTWYADALKPLFEMEESVAKEEPWWEESDKVEVEIIDDDGDEQVARVDRDNVLDETEEILEQQDAAGAED